MASEQQLMEALRRADAAGDEEAARAIAQRIQSMREQPVQAGQGLGVMAAENPFAQLQKRVSAGEQLSPTEQKQYTATRDLLLKREAAGDPIAIDIMRQARQYQVEQMGTGERILAGAGAGLKQMSMGFGQSVVPIGEKLGLISPEDAARYRTRVDIERARQEPLLNTDAGSFGKLIPDVALGIPLFRAGQAALAPKGAGALRTNVVAPAVTGAGYTYYTQPVGTGESKTGQVALGAGLSAAGQVGGVGVSKAYGGRSAAVQADPVLRDQLAAAERAGITLLPRDVMNSPVFNKIDSLLSNIPFSGASSAAARRQAEVNLAAGKPIGVTTPYIRPGFDAAGKPLELETAAGKAGQAFDDFWKDKRIALGIDDVVALRGLRADILKNSGGDAYGKQIINQIDDLIQTGSKGPITGNKYTTLRRTLQNKAANPNTAEYAGPTLDTLESIASKSIPEAQQKTLQQLRARYADVKRIEPAVDVSGNVNPANIGRNVQTKGKPASAEMRNLATASPVLTNPVPVGIGTTEKLMSVGGLAGAGMINRYLTPLLYGTAVASKSPMVAQYLKGGVPAVAQRVPLVGPTATKFLLPSTQTFGRVAPRTGAVFGAPLARIESDAEMKKRREELIRRQNLLYKGN